MLTNIKYLIKENDQFDSSNYPNLVKDLTCIHKVLAKVPAVYQSDIIVSFSKNHSLKLEWIKANPEFTELVTSGALPIKNMEALFEASTKNSVFRQQLEEYVKSNFCC